MRPRGFFAPANWPEAWEVCDVVNAYNPVNWDRVCRGLIQYEGTTPFPSGHHPPPQPERPRARPSVYDAVMTGWTPAPLVGRQHERTATIGYATLEMYYVVPTDEVCNRLIDQLLAIG